jgi:hypothetical protein
VDLNDSWLYGYGIGYLFGTVFTAVIMAWAQWADKKPKLKSIRKFEPKPKRRKRWEKDYDLAKLKREKLVDAFSTVQVTPGPRRALPTSEERYAQQEWDTLPQEPVR